MAGRFGPASAFLLVDGYNLTATKLTALREAVTAAQTETTGLGDSWKERVPTGEVMVELVQEGAIFDTTANLSHDALSGQVSGAGPQQTQRVVCYGFAGQTIGESFVGIQGAYNHRYDVIATRDDIQRVATEYSASGQRNEGVILQPLAAQTADWDTEATPVDNTASSANGGVGYLQVTAASGFTNFVGTVRDSPDDITYANLVAFTDNVVAPFAERVTVAGTVDRYLAFQGNVTGVGSITAFCGFSRN